MNEQALPAVVPLFRSQTQFRILGELLTHPGLTVTITDLAQRIGVPRPTVSHEIKRLRDAGLISTRRDGNRTLVVANPHSPIAGDLQRLLAKVYGPPAAIRAALRQTRGVKRAVIFGSWAARWHGEPGPVPRDVDLLIIGDVEHDVVWSLAAHLSRDLGIEINPVIRTQQEWQEDPTRFREEVEAGPQVDVTPIADGDD